MQRGKYIVIEGPEGVGKTSQVQELARRLAAANLAYRVFREPDSQTDLTARAIRQLTQDPQYPMNTRTEVLLYNAARSQSLNVIKNSVDQGLICICDRNYLTTLAVQYYGRGDVPDYNTINNIINFAVNGFEPDLCIVLDAPAQMLKERTSSRHQGERFDNLDITMLERIRAGYLWEANQRNYPVVFATETSEKVSEDIWKLVSSTLAVRKTNDSQPASIKEIIAEHPVAAEAKAPSVSTEASEDLLTKNSNGSYTITEAGKAYLENVITNTEDDVYAFKDNLSPTTIAAAMARLSRRADDMRITILDEFANKIGKDEKLLERVITAYGDDSVQQLAGIHVVVENASNLLTKKLEWGRLAAYLEQSTRYIYFDQKDQNGKYRYYTPDYLSSGVKRTYNKTMDEIFDTYSKMVAKLTTYIQKQSKVPKAEQDAAWKAATRAQACDAIRPVLPVATKATVGIFASGQAIESLITHLLSDELPECNVVGKKILTEARKVMPSFLQRVDIKDRGLVTIGYKVTTREEVKALTKAKLTTNNSQDYQTPVELVDYWPKNELDLVVDMLYENSNLSMSEIKQQVAKWSYDDKVAIFKAYIGDRYNRRHRPGRSLERAHYSWDLISDYGIFRDLQRHRIVDDLNWQPLSPRYGYDVPQLVEEANLAEDFEHCFDLSLKLYDSLQRHNYELESQYATLLGHKMRWKVTYNAREAMHIHEIRTSPQGHPGYRKLVKDMHEKLAEVHPLMADSMKFVNKGEDPELTRLAAEKYTQLKLEQLK